MAENFDTSKTKFHIKQSHLLVDWFRSEYSNRWLCGRSYVVFLKLTGFF